MTGQKPTTQTEELRTALAGLTSDSLLIRPVWGMKQLLRLSERLDRLEQGLVKNR